MCVESTQADSPSDRGHPSRQLPAAPLQQMLPKMALGTAGASWQPGTRRKEEALSSPGLHVESLGLQHISWSCPAPAFLLWNQRGNSPRQVRSWRVWMIYSHHKGTSAATQGSATAFTRRGHQLWLMLLRFLQAPKFTWEQGMRNAYCRTISSFAGQSTELLFLSFSLCESGMSLLQSRSED